MALVCCISQFSFAAETHHKTQPITIKPQTHPRFQLDLQQLIEPKTGSPTISVGSPATSVASVSSSGPSSARNPLNIHSPLGSGRLAIETADVQELPEATASSTTSAQVASSASVVQRIAAATLVLTSPATTSAQTTARAESEVKTERAQNEPNSVSRSPVNSHMNFGDPDFDPSVTSVPLTTDTSLLGSHVLDVVAPKAALTESQEFEIPDFLQEGMIGYNTARQALIRHSQSLPVGFESESSKKA
jgi:hypothetical protein